MITEQELKEGLVAAKEAINNNIKNINSFFVNEKYEPISEEIKMLHQNYTIFMVAKEFLEREQ